MQQMDDTGNDSVTASSTGDAIMRVFDDRTRALVRVSAVVCGGTEAQLRDELSAAVGSTDPDWVEEVLLQSYLFAGFPRALNAAREWRKVSGRKAPRSDEGARLDATPEWAERGDVTCGIVYGGFYKKLRHNIAELHPALDAWMIVEGYGKVLSRPGLDLARRELCVVAACAVQRQDRQLHSHLHGALHAGATVADVDASLAALTDFLTGDDLARYRLLWRRVQGHEHHV
jgi:4-carboxymuconolactone decarboxylase